MDLLPRQGMDARLNRTVHCRVCSVQTQSSESAESAVQTQSLQVPIVPLQSSPGAAAQAGGALPRLGRWLSGVSEAGKGKTYKKREKKKQKMQAT